MAVQIQQRRDTAANWTSEDPTLAEGEVGWETDTGKFKLGDGSTAWTSLDYIEGAGAGVASVAAGTGIDVDATDPDNPEVALDSASIASLALADSATQPGDLGTMAAVDDAPSDGDEYVRKDGAWEVATGGGGGGLANWTEAADSSAPNATVPVVSFTATNAATNVDVAICPKGSGAILVDIPNSASTGGNKRGNNAVDLQVSRSAATNVASGTNSGIFSGRNNTSSGQYSSSWGDSCTASGSYCHAFGASNSAGGTGTGALGGSNNATTGSYSVTTGGSSLTADGDYSRVGGYQATARARLGADVYASGQLAAAGDAQRADFVLRRSTSSATPAIVSTNAAGATAAGQIVLPNNGAYIVRGDIIARQNTTGDCKSWEWRATVKRGANAAATAIVGAAVVTVCDEDSGASAWAVSIGVDTTYGALAVTVTGEASKSIKWVSSARSVEVAG